MPKSKPISESDLRALMPGLEDLQLELRDLEARTREHYPRRHLAGEPAELISTEVLATIAALAGAATGLLHALCVRQMFLDTDVAQRAEIAAAHAQTHAQHDR